MIPHKPPPRAGHSYGRPGVVGHDGPGCQAGWAGRFGRADPAATAGRGHRRRPGRDLFAKLYAKSHVHADRWYKVWRTIFYGSLADEAPFQSAGRFVEYEDYRLLRLAHAGIAVPAPFGIVEITPDAGT